MDVTLLATGSPVPTADRGGTAQVVAIDDEPILVDCGPLAVHRMVENGIDPGSVETLFFTHHHVDHNADFFQFAIASWSLGRASLSIYGPEGTADYVEALHDLYEADIDYRRGFDYPAGGVDDVEVVTTDGSLSVETERWTATALPVEHSIETYAYRFSDLSTGQTCVVSGDTRRIEALATFAEGADLLVQDGGIAPVDEDATPDGILDERFTTPLSADRVAKHEGNHCDPEDAGWIADRAGVDTLVLTHLLPFRDTEATAAQASAVFDGEVVVAADGLTLTP